MSLKFISVSMKYSTGSSKSVAPVGLIQYPSMSRLLQLKISYTTFRRHAVQAGKMFGAMMQVALCPMLARNT